MAVSTRNSAEIRALKARIILRNRLKREPSRADVDKYLRGGSNVSLSYGVIAAAFRAGEEVCLIHVPLKPFSDVNRHPQKLVCEAIECAWFDWGLATTIQRNP